MISADNVYNTVLDIIQKENVGYLAPHEFNSIANQVQQEIFEKYFADMDGTTVTGNNDTDYANSGRNIGEKIEFFDVEGTAMPTTFTNPDGTESTSYYVYPDNFYRLGIVSVAGRQIEEVSHKDILYINLSPLAAPSVKQAVYTRHEGGYVVYPKTGITSITLTYIRKPARVNWIGVLAPDGTMVPTIGNEDYQNFELHPSEENEVVNKMLTYTGAVVRDQGVSQLGQTKEGQVAQTEQ